MPTNPIHTDTSTLLYAFRYMLGRQTYGVAEMVGKLRLHWFSIEPEWRVLIHDEIRKAIERKRAGSPADVECWEKVLRLPVDGDSVE